MNLLCLCPEDGDWKLIPAYAEALRLRGVQFLCVRRDLALDSSLEQILASFPERPSCILHFESNFPLLPTGLQRSEVPTICFQVDTYAYTKRRMRWSSLFDHVVVFHPGYEEQFRQSGHPGAFLLPHAVRRELFDRPELPRDFEIGWVGQTCGPLYRKRGRWIPELAHRFRMNDWNLKHSPAEVAEVYRRSRLVVNIGRDDFPQDANLRVFEVLASGALLITALPSELTDLGFVNGVHFAGYHHESQILDIVQHFLRDDAARSAIARAGRENVLQEHTYDTRAEQILARLQQFGVGKLAPARRWRDSQVELAYVDFFAANGVLDCASAKLRRLAVSGLREALEGTALVGAARLRRRRYDSTLY